MTTTKFLIGAALTVFLIVGWFLLWLFHRWDVYTSPTGEDQMAAVIGVIGLVFAAVTSLIGVGIKSSIDERRERREAEADKQRLEREREAEQRLRVDVSIRAAELMGGGAAGEASPTLTAGALLALTNLGELKFALSLLTEMWPRDDISGPNAIWLLGEIFKSDSYELHSEAAKLLRFNASRLLTEDGGLRLPDPLASGWHVELYEDDVRIDVFIAVLTALQSKKFKELRNGVLFAMISMTKEMFESETNDGLKFLGSVACVNIIDAYWEGTVPPTAVIGSPGFNVADCYSEVKSYVERATNEGIVASTEIDRLVQKIPDWRSDE